jgi:hypothetical protein
MSGPAGASPTNEPADQTLCSCQHLPRALAPLHYLAITATKPLTTSCFLQSQTVVDDGAVPPLSSLRGEKRALSLLLSLMWQLIIPTKRYYIGFGELLDITPSMYKY